MRCGGSQRTVWPGERMDPEKEWTGLSWNEVWREPEDRVARRKNGQG